VEPSESRGSATDERLTGVPGSLRPVAWVDVARGLGIVLVVYGHVLRGNFAPAAAPAWVGSQDRLIYAFHMPLFFVLSGLFLWRSVSAGRARFLTSRWSQIVYPYVLWSLLTVGLELAFAGYINSPVTWTDVVLLPFRPVEQYWFLYALLVLQLVAAAAYPSKVLYAAAAIAGLLVLQLAGGEWIGLRAFAFAPFIVAGVLLGSRLFALAAGPAAGKAALAIAGWSVFALLLAGSDPFAGTPLAGLLAGLSGALGTIGVAMLAASSPLSHGLAELGRASLAIFVAHTIVSAGLRIALRLVGFAPAGALSVTVALIGGLLAPYLLWRWAGERDWTVWLGFGGNASRRRQARPVEAGAVLAGSPLPRPGLGSPRP
jgi:fucose 4-O-acetylase-like acetyltransferase